ncbi:bacteriophage CI repressor [Dyadobacter bucti]|uniref:bacteriophage CI repressor n=1 Tax=Dyadobacter bucti TaxID=2572203 RepID=UPI001109082E|nr:bacteriophage CI repressor [Dyadobacter bucti]
MAEEVPKDQPTEPKKKRFRRSTTPKKKPVKTADLPDSIEIFERFNQVVDYLLKEKIMKSKYYFTNKYGLGATIFSLKSNSKTASLVPAAFLALLVKEFGVSAHWLLTGEGPMTYKTIKPEDQEEYTFLNEVKEFDLDALIPHHATLWINKPLKIYKREGSKNYFLYDSETKKLFEFESGEFNPLTRANEYKKVLKAFREKFKPILDYNFTREVTDFNIDEYRQVASWIRIKFFTIYSKPGLSTFFLLDQKQNRLFEFIALNHFKLDDEKEQRKVVKEFRLMNFDNN